MAAATAQNAENPAAGSATRASASAAGSGGGKAAERKRLRAERLAYVAKHGEELEKVAAHCVNCVLYDKPVDPYASLLDRLSEFTSAGVRFMRLHARPAGQEAILCEIAASVRGAPVTAHSASLPRALVAHGLVALGRLPAPAEGEEPAAASAASAAAALASSFGDLASGAEVLDLDELRRRLAGAFGAGGAEGAEARLALRLAFEEMLLEAAARLLGCSALDAVQGSLSKHGVTSTGPLQCQLDLEAWQRSWPELLLPVAAGGEAEAAAGAGAGGRRLLVGISAFAASLPEVKERYGPTEFVDEVSALYRVAAQEEAKQAGMEAEAQTQHEADEYCPFLNAFELASKLANEVADRVASSGQGLASDEDIAATLASFRAAIDEIAPSYASANSMEVTDSRILRPGSVSPSSGVDMDLREAAGACSALERQQRIGCIYCFLDLDAEAAFDAEAGGYAVSGEGGERKCTEDLAAHYARLCENEPLLRGIVRPFSQRDPKRLAGLIMLHELLAEEVVVVDDEAAPVADTGSSEDCGPPGGAEGVVRDLNHGAFGVVGQYMDGGEGATLFSGRHGIYDLTKQFAGVGAAMADREGEEAATGSALPSAAPYILCSLALPELSHRFLLPRAGSPQELDLMVRPFAGCLRRLLTAAYARSEASDGREKSSSLKLNRFKEGLRRLGYAGVDECADRLFNFLDTGNNGMISAVQLKLLAYISGPAPLKDLDNLRTWLVTRHKRKGKAGQHPIRTLLDSIDNAGTGRLSFMTFKRGMRRMRHPIALGDSDARLRELFMCFDVKNAGFVETETLRVLSLYSARRQLSRVASVRDMLKERFGSLKAAFKSMDADKNGSLTGEEWLKKMQDVPDAADDLAIGFYFIDKDGDRRFTGREFDSLGSFSEERFLEDLASLRALLADKFGPGAEGLAQAFAKFAPGGAEAGETEAAGASTLSPKDFRKCCQAAGYKASTDPGLLFNFLDAMHVGCLRVEDLQLLDKLPLLAELESLSVTMSGAIESFRTFALSQAKEEQDGFLDLEELLEKVHESLREVTKGDLF